VGYGESFDLGKGAADILIQCRSADAIWQKERLLNMAVRALPTSCDTVVWIDCDVAFTNADWIDQVNPMLDRYPLIQPFQRIYHLLPDQTSAGEQSLDVLLKQPSLAAAVAVAQAPKDCLGKRTKDRTKGNPATGVAWAGRRDLLERHGFYEACIVGGGTRAMAGAAYGCFENIIATHAMNPRQQDHYMAWGQPFFDTVKGAVSSIDADLLHLWHGHLADRRVDERHQGLAAFDFDPYQDISSDANGCLRWNSDKPAMHAYVRNYFASRKEDGSPNLLMPDPEVSSV
jgi:hypothetical protein